MRTTSRLTHPNTVTVYDYGRTEEGTLYYAMELLDGATIRDIVKVGGAQPAARVARMLAMVAGALGEAHSVGLIHRDIKPSNILLCRQGGERDVAKVVDFGLVKEQGLDAVDPETNPESMLAGTPLYMAPDLLADAPRVEPSSDLYSLGAVAYYMLTGEHVFRGATHQVILQQLRDTPIRPSIRLGAPVPADLESLILSLLEKRPTDRPSDAAEVRRRVEACACFGLWTEADAEAWWHAHAEALAARRRSVSERPDPRSVVTLTNEG